MENSGWKETKKKNSKERVSRLVECRLAEGRRQTFMYHEGVFTYAVFRLLSEWDHAVFSPLQFS